MTDALFFVGGFLTPIVMVGCGMAWRVRQFNKRYR